MIQVLENLKRSLLDVLQQQAGKLGADFASDLKFSVVGSFEFKVMDKSQKDKVILDLTLPVNAGGDFRKVGP